MFGSEKCPVHINTLFLGSPNWCEMDFTNNLDNRRGEDNNLLLVISSLNHVNQKEIIPLACG